MSYIRREVDRLWATVNHMDEVGTRGVTALQVQVNEMIKDIADLKSTIDTKFATQTATRRWFVTQLFTMVGLIIAVLSVLFAIVTHK